MIDLDQPTPPCDWAEGPWLLVCRNCGASVPASLPRPVYRACGSPARSAAPLVLNRIDETGPCVHRGELLRVEPNRSCGCRDKETPVYRCLSPDVEADEVSEERWWAGQSRASICRWCAAYRPRPSG